MKGDFTRRTFRSDNHYRAVLLQQGRVQLDADWNEQVDIEAYLDQAGTADIVGPHGGPLHGAGMAITDAGGGIPAGTAGADLRVGAGHYYVDGVLCENDEPVPLGAQPDLPGVALPGADGRYAAYLDVWCEHVTALERPELREVALGGPDTATRERTIWQLRLVPVAPKTDCADVAPPWLPPGAESTAALRARAQAPVASPSPCVIPTTAGYRRLENQLYRVEVFDDGTAGRPTYVWSRDNGSVVVGFVAFDPVAGTVTIDAPGRDERLGFAKNDWIEVVDVARVRRGEHGFLGRLDDADGTRLTVAEWAGGAVPAGLGEAAVVRRWDSPGAVEVLAGWVDLEDGVQVEFRAGGAFHTGDYWLIPARTANLQGGQVDPDLAGDVEWPRGPAGPLFVPRAGVEHRFAAVALLDLLAGNWTLASDCRRLFPPLTELTDVEYAGGDGQEAMPGDPLPQPLEVSVSNGTAPVPGATVRFTAADADGRLAPAAAGLPASTVSSVDVPTDAGGVARCFWRLAPDVARPSQRLTARLLGPGATPTGAPVDFAGRLSIADQVWLDAGKCEALKGVRTVQDAVDRLIAARSVVAVGGDGQDGPPGAALPLPAEVLVRTDCGPVVKAGVRFTASSAGVVAGDPAGLGSGASTVDLLTGADGVARCFWRLGPGDPVQALTAQLLDEGVPVEQPTRVAFTANAANPGGVVPGMHVTAVVMSDGKTRVLNDSFVSAGDLVGGIAVLLDRQPLEKLVNGKPVLTLTLDVPFPFSAADQELWGNPVVGTQPLTLAATVAAGNQAITWVPTAPCRALLTDRLFPLMQQLKRGDRVLCHLTLNGRAVADSNGDEGLVVNGLALARLRADGGTDLALPTVDDVHGADFTMWFWLVARISTLVIVPSRTGMLRLKTARDAVAAVLPREELAARLPREVAVAPGVADLDAARRAADRAFRDRPERRLALVVDKRAAPAVTVLRGALRQLDVELDATTAADPAAAVRGRIEAGSPVDGVLTIDDDGAAAVTGLDGFGEAIPL
jgi:hypothetical protein